MKRNPVLLCLFIALAVSLLLLYSLMGAMTGVYVYNGEPFGMNGHGYVIRRGDAWYEVYYSSPRHVLPEAMKLEIEHIDISPGIWAMTLKTRRNGRTVHAFASWNPVDIYRFTFGDYRTLGRSPGPP